MANRTDPAAKSIRVTDPQNLVGEIVRSKIYRTTYWKEQCFGLTAEMLVDKAMELDHIGGGTTPFMCLILKMLQIQPEKDIVVEFIKNGDCSKYVRVLGAFYLRLTGTYIDIYRYLEPLYNDYRKLMMRSADGKFVSTHVDEVIDDLLTKDYACGMALPRVINKRWKPRKSVLEDDFEEEEEKEEMDRYRRLRDDKDYRRERDRGGDREREGKDRERRDRDRGGGRWRRSRSRSRDRKRPRRDGGIDDHQDPEIAEANRMRASLGLKPLK